MHNSKNLGHYFPTRESPTESVNICHPFQYLSLARSRPTIVSCRFFPVFLVNFHSGCGSCRTGSLQPQPPLRNPTAAQALGREDQTAPQARPCLNYVAMRRSSSIVTLHPLLSFTFKSCLCEVGRGRPARCHITLTSN